MVHMRSSMEAWVHERMHHMLRSPLNRNSADWEQAYPDQIGTLWAMATNPPNMPPPPLPYKV